MLLDDLSDSEFDVIPVRKPVILDDSDFDELEDFDLEELTKEVQKAPPPPKAPPNGPPRPALSNNPTVKPTAPSKAPQKAPPKSNKPTPAVSFKPPAQEKEEEEDSEDVVLEYPKPLTPTHHPMSDLTGSFLYPSNLPFRTYQHTIIQSSLIENTLCSLPTGLGKTFIASVVMLNFYRWFTDAKIIFMAPTKPLVSQQIDACLRVTGIPRHDCSVLMGGVKQGEREHEWATKRVFFATPQVVELDLDGDVLDPKKVALLVVDEAHHTSGKYSYGTVVKKLLDSHQSFRVLGLTATPASKVEGVQNVVKHLLISHLEVKGEQDPDVQQYMHNREEVKINVDVGEDIKHLLSVCGEELKPTLNMLHSKGVLQNVDIAKISLFGVKKEIERYMFRTRYLGPAAQYKYRGVGAVLASIAHATQLLQHQGITQFYDTLKRKHDEEMARKQPTKSYEQIGDVGTILTEAKKVMAKKDYLSHPKLDYLSAELAQFFSKAPEGASTGTCIIFARFRSSVNVILEHLKQFPAVKPHEFIGQAPSREEGGGRGMTQKKQQEVINKFRKGVFNTLVATSIAEEGLDIGQVDLIICYDSNASPITSLQRMGRTGRARDGRVVLLMTDKEMENNVKSRDNYAYIQRLMEDGSRVKLYPPNRVIPGKPDDPPPPHFMQLIALPGENKKILEQMDNDASGLELADVVAKGDKALRLRKDKNGHFIVPQKKKKKVFKMPDNATLGFMTAKEMAEKNSQESEGHVTDEDHVSKKLKLDLDSIDDMDLEAELEAELDAELDLVAEKSRVQDLEDEAESRENQHIHDLVELDEEGERDLTMEEFLEDDDFDRELDEVLNAKHKTTEVPPVQQKPEVVDLTETPQPCLTRNPVPSSQPKISTSLNSSSFDDDFFDRLDEALAKGKNDST